MIDNGKSQLRSDDAEGLTPFNGKRDIGGIPTFSEIEQRVRIYGALRPTMTQHFASLGRVLEKWREVYLP